MGLFNKLKEYFYLGTSIYAQRYVDLEEENSPNTLQPTLFHPLTFHQFIGQYGAKQTLKGWINAVKKRNILFPHTLIYTDLPGTGKTSLARIIAKTLNIKIIELITGNIENYYILKSHINEVEGGIIFLDEIHSLNRTIAEQIYTLMEDRTIPFTIIGATTEYGELLETRKPFVERFELKIELEDYKKEDLINIGKQYKSILFPKDIVKEEDYIILADNCRYTPRNLLSLLKSLIFLETNIKEILNNFGIIKDGYTRKDLKTLIYIKENDKGVGLQGLCSYLGTSVRNYLYSIEPYILKNKLITRTNRGRKITNEGIRMIEYLNQ